MYTERVNFNGQRNNNFIRRNNLNPIAKQILSLVNNTNINVESDIVLIEVKPEGVCTKLKPTTISTLADFYHYALNTGGKLKVLFKIQGKRDEAFSMRIPTHKAVVELNNLYGLS